ncbi:MAG TPA: AAA family ATPase [Chloroflexota bacterium]|nr:AAA family ATPase [Chloroflexota bacterium]
MTQPREVAVTLTGTLIRQPSYRFLGFAFVRTLEGQEYRLPLTGTVAQWLVEGERYWLTLRDGAAEAVGFDDYTLRGKVPIWPLFERTYRAERRALLSGKPLYAYQLLAREARYERDYEAIVELEQYHYASDEEILAIWHCERCGRYQDANARPSCAACGRPMRFHELKSATRASRFLVLELGQREPYEPQYIGYVRADPPVPLMHRRLPDGTLERNIRLRVFPRRWFAHPFRLPEEVPGEQWWERQAEALRTARAPVARLARVVIHPDYRADGLGQQALTALKDWVRDRWIPDMRVAKQAIETIAMMARYNPFLEKAGFRYLWDTAGGRPVLYYPFTRRAAEAIETFLRQDPVAHQHGGKLFQPRFTAVEALATPLAVHGLTKAYTSRLTLEQLSVPVGELLEAFGVHHRVVQKTVLHDAEVEIAPGTVNVVVGASGSGKTTLLRLLYGLAAGLEASLYRPDAGEAAVPANVRAQALLPGELEPTFGDTPIVQVLYECTRDEALAVELLNEVGLADAVLYRAPFRELSTGQKERVKLAYLLAQRPNLLLVDEFAAHLDPASATRLARRMAALVRDKRLTLVVATHRPEVIEALEPDALYFCGYGALVRAGALPQRAFRVLEPYASQIVEGKKTWELRTYPTTIRGRVGVVSGGRMLGTVEVTGTRGPLSAEELEQAQDRHLADPRFLQRYARGRRLYAWELAKAQKFAKPVEIAPRAGQQTWLRSPAAR